MTPQDQRDLEPSSADSYRRLRFLYDAFRSFAEVMNDLQSVLDAVVSRVAAELADGCGVMLVSQRGDVLELAAIRHRDPEAAAASRKALTSAPLRLDEDTFPTRVIKTGKSMRVDRLPDPSVPKEVRDKYRERMESYPIGSIVVVPLNSSDGVIGVLMASRTPQAQPFSAEDEALLQDLADRAALAIGHAHAFEGERVARERFTLLQLLASALGREVDRDEVARVAVEDGCAPMGASFGLLYVVTRDGSLKIAATTGVSDEFLEDLRNIEPDSVFPCARVVRSREALFIEDQRQLRAIDPTLADHLTRFDRGPSLAAVPLLAEGECLGALAFGFLEPRVFSDADRIFTSMVAHHCAQALYRARIIDRERRTHEQITVLAEAGRIFAESLDYDTTLENIVRISLPALGDFCVLDVEEADGTIRRIPGAHDDPETLARLQRASAACAERTTSTIAEVASGRSALFPRLDDPQTQPLAAGLGAAALLRELETKSMIVVPLMSAGAILGALTLCYGSSQRRHTTEDLRLAEELANRAAQALQNARLHRSLRIASERAERAAREAEDASRLKDDFLATVSHELRTPLSAILGWSSMLATRNDPTLVARGLSVIERNARSQLRIIEDILDVSKIVRGELHVDFADVEIDRIASDVVESFRPAARAKGVTLEVRAAEQPMRMVGDAERLRQIAWNLVANAVKFTEEDGSVVVSLDRKPEGVVMSVRDTGQGIDPRFLPHVFERFRQADSGTCRRSGGLGLGLAIVRHLTEIHGGTVDAQSEGRGKGSTFSVTLPVRAISAPVSAAPTSASKAAGTLMGRRVLLVDDQPDARELLETLLESAGAQTCSLSSAQEALAALETFNPDVVVSDIGMPVHDGYWLMERFRRLRPTTPAIALTAFARREDEDRARASGFDHHVAKPVKPEELLQLVASCCDGVEQTRV